MAWPESHGYASVDDVEKLFTSSDLYTNLDSERIGIAITDASIEIDGVFARFYLTPIAAPAADFAFTMTGMICKYLAASIIQKHFFVSANPDGKAQGQAWHDYAYGFIDQIVPPRDSHPPYFQPPPVIRFVNATLQTNSEMPQFPEGSGATFNPDNDAARDTDQAPYFRRTDSVQKKGGFM